MMAVAFWITLYLHMYAFPSNFVVPSQIAGKIISSGAQTHNKSNLHVLPLYINLMLMM